MQGLPELRVPRAVTDRPAHPVSLEQREQQGQRVLARLALLDLASLAQRVAERPALLAALDQLAIPVPLAVWVRQVHKHRQDRLEIPGIPGPRVSLDLRGLLDLVDPPAPPVLSA